MLCENRKHGTSTLFALVDLQADRGGIVFLKLPFRVGVVGSGEASFVAGLQRGWNASELNLAVIAAGLLGEPLRFGLPELRISDLGWTSRFGGASPSVSRLSRWSWRLLFS